LKLNKSTSDKPDSLKNERAVPSVLEVTAERLPSDSVVIRKLMLHDDLIQVGRLIYYTDDFVFPYVYDNVEEGARVHAEMIRRDTIYNYGNITVALAAGKIVGIVVMKESPVKVSYDEMVRSFEAANVVHDERFERVFNEYWGLLEKEPEGFYIANVCVDPEVRHRGVARALLSFLLEDDKTYNLETVVANVNAFKLYQSLGFVVDYQYPGFTGVPCYRMHRMKISKTEEAEHGI
jgi:ribosomal protein S18 acetylase RimI-like enzyme